jgi:FAD:protein FMN transferase
VVVAASGFDGRSALGDDGVGRLERFDRSEVHMATVVKVVVYASSKAAATAGIDAAFNRVKDLNDLLSDYVEESELNRLCRSPSGMPVRLSRELFDVLDRSEFWRRESDGGFDVTAGPMIRLWRQARKTKRLPSPKQIADAMTLLGGDKIALDPKARTAVLSTPGMRIDLGGIAKGYVGDEILKVLAKQGLNRAMVVLGGDVVLGDPPPNAKGWTVAIAELVKDRETFSLKRTGLVLANCAASTSGDASQFSVIDGKRYSHIVDPRTGQAQVGRRQTTIVAKKGLDADALATAATVLGPELGAKLADKHDAAALFMSRDEGKRTEIEARKRLESSNQRWKDLPKVEWTENRDAPAERSAPSRG